jgi:predicted dehydrogenase
LSAAAAASLAAAEANAAEKPVRVGIIGAGGRGTSLLRPLVDLPGVEVPAVCDIDDNAVARAQRITEEAGKGKPAAYARGPEDYRRMLERTDLDGVIIATPWQLHAPMTLAAIDAGKAAAVEVPAAITLDECWALVEAAEKPGASATMLENWVYRREPLAVLNIARAGLLGEVVHCESGYGHDVRAGKFDVREANKGDLAWRGEHSVTRNGNLYPTHQFAPTAMLMDINHGARIESLVAMAGPSRGMNRYAADMWGADHPNAKRTYANADRATVLIQLEDGRTAINFHDTQSWHPRDDGHKYHGTKGMVRWPFPGEGTIWLLDRHWDGKTPDARQWHSLNPFLDEFDHPVWKAYGERALSFGHNGADWLELRGWVESVRHMTPPPVAMADAVTWSAIGPLSEQSIAGKARKMEMPDFTRRNWKTNPRFELRWQWS